MDNNNDLLFWKLGQMNAAKGYAAAAKGKGGQSMSAQYAAVLAAMTTAPSAADQVIQATMLDALVAGGYFAKAELLDVFAVHNADSSLINWKNPGTFNPSKVNSPTFTQYKGYTGIITGSHYLRSNFIPSSNGTLIGQNNICHITGVTVAATSTGRYEAGANSGTSFFISSVNYNGTTTYFYCNDAASKNLANTKKAGHFTMSRGSATAFDGYVDKTKTSLTSANSVSLINKELYICGRNNNDAAEICNSTLGYYFVFSYLTEAEVQGIVTIMEAYLDAYGFGVIA